MKGPQSGIRIVEQGTCITATCCGMMLADLGADAIKIETPGTDDPYRCRQSGLSLPHYRARNHTKRTIAPDLKAAA